MKTIYIYISIASILLLLSCDSLLDVSPKDQVNKDQMFDNEEGYYSALAGVYSMMGDEKLYGKAMTISEMEIMGNAISIAQPTLIDLYPDFYKSTGLFIYRTERNNRHEGIETFFTEAWTSSYKTIANCNLMIENLEKQDAALFEEGVKDILLGEILALRAYCHFDMLRLFQPPYATEEGKTQKRIPYITQIGYDFTPSSSSDEIFTEIIKDLERAAGLMKDTDPLSSGKKYETAMLRSSRLHKMNYYAVKALQARVYLYKSDYREAYDAAMEVLNAAAGIHVRFLNAEDLKNKDAAGDYVLRSSTMENVFGLLVDKLGDHAFKDRNAGYSYMERLRLVPNRYKAYYSSTNDIRMLAWKKGTTTSNTYMYKYERPTLESNLVLYPKATVPLLKLGEIYLIAAEAAAEAVSTTEALRILGELQTARDGGVFKTDDKAAIIAEILKEYRRELIGDGQLFFAYKRRYVPEIEKGYSVSGVIPMNVAKYTPDIPSDEYNGGRTY